MAKRVIVAGGRDFTDEARLKRVLDHLLDPSELDYVIVSGCAKGADTLGIEYAERLGYGVDRRPAEWDIHGKAAGVIRNQEMSQVADILVAFWDGKSRGTKDMIERMARAKKEIHLYFY